MTPTAAPQWQAAAADVGARLRDWLGARCGMHFADAKLDLLAQRLQRVAEQFDAKNLDELAAWVERETDPRVVEAVVAAASTNHTYSRFTRESENLSGR